MLIHSDHSPRKGVQQNLAELWIGLTKQILFSLNCLKLVKFDKKRKKGVLFDNDFYSVF